MNPLWLILLLGGGALYATKIANVGKRLSITILNVQSLKIVNGALQLVTNIALDNPTGNTISIRKPNIKVFYENNEVGNSIPSADIIDIKKYSRTIMNNINIQVPISNLPTVFLKLLVGNGGKKVKIDVEVSTQAEGIHITQRKTFEI